MTPQAVQVRIPSKPLGSKGPTLEAGLLQLCPLSDALGYLSIKGAWPLQSLYRRSTPM
jgi:hypothetical protein